MARPTSVGTFQSVVRRTGLRLVNAALAPTGCYLARAAPPPPAPPPPLDLRGVTADPVEGAYLARDRAFLVDVSLRHCRCLGTLGFVCSLDAGHPYVETLLAYERGRCSRYADSPARAYHAAWQPANAAEALGLDPSEANRALRDAPHMAFVFPWESIDAATRMEERVRWRESYRLPDGRFLTVSDGIQSAGPVSEAKGNLEFRRFTSMYESIKRNGYRRSNTPDGDIRGEILISDGVSRIRLDDGNHRVAALVALGYERVPVRLYPHVIHRCDVASWPKVRNGLFTQQQGLAVFDRFLDGGQPAKYSPKWGSASSCRPIVSPAKAGLHDRASVAAP